MPIHAAELNTIFLFCNEFRCIPLIVRLYEDIVIGVIRQSNSGKKMFEIKTDFFTGTDPNICKLLHALKEIFPDFSIYTREHNAGCLIIVEW